MWSILASFGVGLFKVYADIQKEKSVQANAATEEERIASNERIANLEARKQIILNATPLDTFVKAMYAFIFLPYWFKILVWDKVIMASWFPGKTDDLSPNQWTVFLIILGGYFLHDLTTRFLKR